MPSGASTNLYVPMALNDSLRFVGKYSTSGEVAWGEPQGQLTTLEKGAPIGINNEKSILALSPESKPLLWRWIMDANTGVASYKKYGLRVDDSIEIASPTSLNDSGAITVRSRKITDDAGVSLPQPGPWTPTLLIRAELAVDNNRDGIISLSGDPIVSPMSDLTSKEKPFRFWSNDDDDHGDVDGSDIPNPSNSSDGAAATNFEGDGFVDGARDLVDFFPVFLDIKQLLTVLPPSASIKYKLKQADGALNFVYTKLSRTDALKYQTEAMGLIYGPTLSQPVVSAGTMRISAAGVELTSDFLTGVKNQDWGVILVETWQPTTKPLVLSVEKSDGTVIVEVKLEIKISSVEDMYRRLNFRDSNGQPPAGLLGDTAQRDEDLGLPTYMGESDGTGPKGYPDSLTNGKWFVMVIGSNVGGQKMRGWQSEVFKRMWWSKSKARFIGVSWYGDPYSDGNDLVYDYHSAARNAFATAPALATALNALTGSKTVAGHSAAALIISSAVVDCGLNATNTCLLDAAMARECYDGSSADDLVGMVPEVWRNYPAVLWSARWSESFVTSDARSTLTWRNRFRNATNLTTVHNFYSSTEEVLGRYDGTVDGSIIENLRAPGSFAWVIQEKAKGDKLRIGWFIHAGSDYGGWGFNLKDPLFENDGTYWKWDPNRGRLPKTAAELGTISSTILRRHPVFEPGWGKLGLNDRLLDTSPSEYIGPSWIFDLYGATTGNTIASDPVKRTQLLNEAIPATSLAVGANYTARFGDSNNYNMPSLYANAAHWPSARGVDKTSGIAVPNWHHSDMREVAYIYLYPFFDKLSSLSNQ